MSADLLELADRVEKLDGPSRNLDAKIWLETTDGATRRQWSYVHKASGKSGELIIVPEYTASIDAAMTLVPEGWEFLINSGCNYANVWEGKEVGDKSVSARALGGVVCALTAASLRARASQ